MGTKGGQQRGGVRAAREKQRRAGCTAAAGLGASSARGCCGVPGDSVVTTRRAVQRGRRGRQGRQGRSGASRQCVCKDHGQRLFRKATGYCNFSSSWPPQAQLCMHGRICMHRLRTAHAAHTTAHATQRQQRAGWHAGAMPAPLSNMPRASLTAMHTSNDDEEYPWRTP